MAPYLYRHVFRSVKVNGISAALPDIAYLIGSRRVYSRYEQYNPEPIVDTVDEPVADDEVRRKHINSTYKVIHQICSFDFIIDSCSLLIEH